MDERLDIFEHLEELRELVRHQPNGLFVDLDGTLAPIATSPGVVRITQGVRHTLEALVCVSTVVVLTGRSVSDARRIIGLDAVIYAGNHGLEWWNRGSTYISPDVLFHLENMHQFALEAALALGTLDGVLVEDKGVTVAIHFRQSAVPDSTRQTIFEFIDSASSAKSLFRRQGKMIVEVRPPVSADKGTALEAVVTQKNLQSALVLGDDLTDLDSFRAIRELRRSSGLKAAAIAVVSAETPAEVLVAADYHIAGTSGVERFLDWLARR